MRPKLKAQVFCGVIFATACLSVMLMWGSLRLGYIVARPLPFWLLFGGVLLAETLPVKIPRRGEDEEITLSTSFSMALLLAGGLGPALIAQGVASVIQDRHAGKPWWRVRFNLGQYSLALIAALLALRLLGAAGHVGSSHPFADAQFAAVLVSAAAFFVVNTGSVGVAVALFQGMPIGRYFRRESFFVISTAGVLLLLAPIVVATTAYSPLLVPLFAAPILVIHNALRQGARSDHAARHDPLTGLPNRAAFREGVEHFIAGRTMPFCVLLMDLDRFKEVNDTLGHHYGDLLLQQVAGRLREELREQDQIARLGGDEFAILSRGREGATAVAQRIVEALRPPFELDEIVVDVQASLGIAMYPTDGDDVEALLQRADVAMYHAKENRTGVSLYDERHDHHSPSKLALSADLRAAIQSSEIVAWYQPELDLKSGQVLAVEALVRWCHPELGLLAPSEFIELAERTNLIRPLTQRVLSHALGQVAHWQAMDLDVTVAVNISTAVLIDDRFTESVLTALAEARVPPRRLKLEITESTLMADPAMTRAILQELHQAGIEISIDDFGTGYSSLAYLADLPVSEVKIDRSFVSRMGVSPKEAIIVNSTIDLAHHLGLRAVAEGVEDRDLLLRLRSLGCDAAQGYIISRPLTSDDATRWLVQPREPLTMLESLAAA